MNYCAGETGILNKYFDKNIGHSKRHTSFSSENTICLLVCIHNGVLRKNWLDDMAALNNGMFYVLCADTRNKIYNGWCKRRLRNI